MTSGITLTYLKGIFCIVPGSFVNAYMIFSSYQIWFLWPLKSLIMNVWCALQMERKNSPSHIYCTCSVDQGSSAGALLRLVDGCVEHERNTVLFNGPGMSFRSSFEVKSSCRNIFVYLIFCGFTGQRGTCLSTPLTPSSMSQFKFAEDLADYLKHFWADNIVNDAEFIRKTSRYWFWTLDSTGAGKFFIIFSYVYSEFKI